MLSATAQRLCRRFSIAEIQLATDGFSDARLIGRGGFGKVYKGLIDEGRQTVAVKRLGRFSSQGGDEFSMEIETLSKLRHVNLVSLIGYCNENEEMIIIYEYIFNGTLADHLFKLPSLTWKQRLKICIGAGRALDYLHTGTSIIHRDVKSKNILLDENFRAKVSDFGLAKHSSSSITLSHISASVKGTPGYWDPNYFTSGRLTKKSDTYAFGVVLLEVLTGRPALDETLDENEPCMTEWAKAKIQNGKANQIVASNLRDEISADCLKIFVGVAKRCLDHEPKKRPTMAQAVLQLESALELQEKRTHRLSRFPLLEALWGRAKPSVSHPAPETEHKNNETLDTLPVGVPTIPVEELKLYTLPIDVPAIPLDELKEITDNFSSKCIIGEGSKGSVYHGILKCGEAVAIKRWRGYSNEEFLIQVSLLSKLRHDNVVQLLGYFFDDEWRVLAYEYTPHGSLYEILSVPLGSILDKASGLEGSDGTQPTPTLSWAKRVKTAVEAARALDYIHQKSKIHGHLTSRNILMFDNYHTAKIANVGMLDQAADMGLCIPTTFAVGTFDYHAPEYTMSGQLSWKCDVYNFGVVLLELVTGYNPFDNKRLGGQQHLVKLAIPKIRANTVEENVDIRLRLKGGHTLKAVTMMVLIAELCVQEEESSRPNMCVVAELLQSLLDASMSVSQLIKFKSKAASSSEDKIWLKMMELCPLEPRT